MNDMTKLTARIERNLGWIVLSIVLVGCLLVLWPFVSALLWAIVLCFSTWPLYQRLLKWLRGRKTLAAATMTLAMMLVVLAPFLIIGSTLADSVKELAAAARHALETGPPQPPGWPRCQSSANRRANTGRAWPPTPESWRAKYATTSSLRARGC